MGNKKRIKGVIRRRRKAKESTNLDKELSFVRKEVDDFMENFSGLLENVRKEAESNRGKLENCAETVKQMKLERTEKISGKAIVKEVAQAFVFHHIASHLHLLSPEVILMAITNLFLFDEIVNTISFIKGNYF